MSFHGSCNTILTHLAHNMSMSSSFGLSSTFSFDDVCSSSFFNSFQFDFLRFCRSSCYRSRPLWRQYCSKIVHNCIALHGLRIRVIIRVIGIIVIRIIVIRVRRRRRWSVRRREGWELKIVKSVNDCWSSFENFIDTIKNRIYNRSSLWLASSSMSSSTSSWWSIINTTTMNLNNSNLMMSFSSMIFL